MARRFRASRNARGKSLRRSGYNGMQRWLTSGYERTRLLPLREVLEGGFEFGDLEH